MAITWNEALLEPFAYTDLNICWDAPAGWAGAGPAPTTQDYEIFTPEGTPLNGRSRAPTCPARPRPLPTSPRPPPRASGPTSPPTARPVAGSTASVPTPTRSTPGCRAWSTRPTTSPGTMTITLEAPASGPAQFEGLLATGEYVTGGAAVPPAALRPPRPPAVAGQQQPDPGRRARPVPVRLRRRHTEHADRRDPQRRAHHLRPRDDGEPEHGTAVVNPDGTYTYTPTDGYVGPGQLPGAGQRRRRVLAVDGEHRRAARRGRGERHQVRRRDLGPRGRADPLHDRGGQHRRPVVDDITLADPNAPGCATTIPTLPVQAVETIECTYVPTVDDVGTYTNVATASSTDLAGPAASNDVDVEVVNAATPRLEIRKSTTQTSVEVGADITYEIEVTNTGGVLLTGVAVTDPNAPDCARTIGNLAIGARTVYACTLAATAADGRQPRQRGHRRQQRDRAGHLDQRDRGGHARRRHHARPLRVQPAGAGSHRHDDPDHGGGRHRPGRARARPSPGPSATRTPASTRASRRT